MLTALVRNYAQTVFEMAASLSRSCALFFLFSLLGRESCTEITVRRLVRCHFDQHSVFYFEEAEVRSTNCDKDAAVGQVCRASRARPPSPCNAN